METRRNSATPCDCRFHPRSFLLLPRIIYVPTTFRPPSYFSWPARSWKLIRNFSFFNPLSVDSSSLLLSLPSLEIWRASFCPLDFAVAAFSSAGGVPWPTLLTIYPFYKIEFPSEMRFVGIFPSFWKNYIFFTSIHSSFSFEPVNKVWVNG